MKKRFLMVLFLVISIIIQLIYKKVSIFFVCIDCLIILFILGSYLEKKEIYSKMPNIMTDKRNYDKMLICDEKHLNNINIDKNNTLLMTNYKRNLYTDLIILERYYSFLHANGECILVLDFNDYKYLKDKTVNTLDYFLLHIVTLYENNINIKSTKYKITKMLNKYKIILCKLKFYSLFRKRKTEFEDIKSNMIKLNDFAKERNIYIKILTKNLEKEIKEKYSNINFEKNI